MSELEIILFKIGGLREGGEAENLSSVDEKRGQNRFLNFEEQPRVQLLRELSKEVCVRCETLNEEACADCRIHRLINQLLNEITR